MTINKSGNLLPGYEGGKSTGTWNISYSMNGGVKVKDDGSSVRYSGDGRRAFLPVCPEGNEVLALL